MDVIVVTINRSDDWNYHRLLVNSLKGYTFVSIYKKGIYDTKLDVSYYLVVKNDIVLPLRDEEYENIRIKFKLFRDKAVLTVYLKNEFLCSYDIAVYDKDTLDLDMLIELFGD